MKLFIGIDVSSKDLQVAFTDSEHYDKPLVNKSFSNDLIGANEVKHLILQQAAKNHYDQIILGMEATSIYSFHPAYFFANDEDLKKFNLETDVVNPRSTKRFHEAFEENKNDPIDAYYIAEYLRYGKYRVTIARQEEYLALQRLTRTRFEISQSLVRAKQHFIEALYYRLNKLVKVDKDKIKTPIFGATIMSIITDSKTIDEIANMSTEDLIDYLQTKGRGRFSDPGSLAKAIQKAIRGSYRLGKVMKYSIDSVLSVYYAEIQNYHHLIKELDKSITKIVAGLPEAKVLQTIPGIGPVCSAGIIAEIGSISRFNDEAKLAKYAGLAWRQKESGDFNSEHTPRLKTGNAYLRYYLVEAANLIRLRDPVFARYYRKKYAEAAFSPHKRACILCARKLSRTIFTLLKNGQIYQTPR